MSGAKYFCEIAHDTGVMSRQPIHEWKSSRPLLLILLEILRCRWYEANTSVFHLWRRPCISTKSRGKARPGLSSLAEIDLLTAKVPVTRWSLNLTDCLDCPVLRNDDSRYIGHVEATVQDRAQIILGSVSPSNAGGLSSCSAPAQHLRSGMSELRHPPG